MLTAEIERAPVAMQTLYVSDEREVAAPIENVFEMVLKPMGPMESMSLKLEAWPGGRWFRDLGNNTGHLWGHVQVIKPPHLLEICGPMFMSYAVAAHIQYRLTEEDGGTLLKFTHQAVGLISREHREGVTKGWSEMLDRIKEAAEATPSRR